jgi:hypothetical protein
MGMSQSAKASASVVAAGVVAAVGGALAACFVVGMLVVLPFASIREPGAIPSSLRPLLYVIWIFFLVCDLFVIVVGIELIRLRPWARVALLVVAGCMLFFGVIGIAVIFFTIFLAPADPAVSKLVLATVLAFVYGIPIGVSLWWLILLTRRSVARQFQTAPAPSPESSQASLPASSPSLFNNPQCPLAVRIVAWYLASFLLFLPIVPFLPIHIPAYYFGHLFRGPSATLILFLNFAVLSLAGVGLLLLKRWSLPLTVASQAILCANGLMAAFSPSFDSVLREVFSELNLPAVPVGVEPMFHYARYFNLLGLAVPLVIIVTLHLSRHSFYAAARSAGAKFEPS